MPTGTGFGADGVRQAGGNRAYRTIGMLYLVMAIVAGLAGGLLAVSLQAACCPMPCSPPGRVGMWRVLSSVLAAAMAC